jgi:hypothetical protein
VIEFEFEFEFVVEEDNGGPSLRTSDADDLTPSRPDCGSRALESTVDPDPSDESDDARARLRASESRFRSCMSSSRWSSPSPTSPSHTTLTPPLPQFATESVVWCLW